MNIEDMNIEQFHEFCGELLKNHPCDGHVGANICIDEVYFTKEVARDDRFSMYVYFDLDGVACDGFVIDRKIEGDSYDIEKSADFLGTLRLSKYERQQAIIEIYKYYTKQE